MVARLWGMSLGSFCTHFYLAIGRTGLKEVSTFHYVVFPPL